VHLVGFIIRIHVYVYTYKVHTCIRIYIYIKASCPYSLREFEIYIKQETFRLNYYNQIK